MDWTNLFTEGILVIITAIVTYFSTRNKNKVDIEKTQSEIRDIIFSTYKVEFESMQNRITQHVNKINELEQKVNRLVQENVSLRGELAEFEKKYGKQTKNRKNKEQDGNTD